MDVFYLYLDQGQAYPPTTTFMLISLSFFVSSPSPTDPYGGKKFCRHMKGVNVESG